MNKSKEKAYSIMLSHFEIMKQELLSGNSDYAHYAYAKQVFINSLEYVEPWDIKQKMPDDD